MDTARSEVPSDAAMYTVGTNLLVDVGVPSTTNTSYKVQRTKHQQNIAIREPPLGLVREILTPEAAEAGPSQIPELRTP
jgi:hypothetical protein